MVVDPGKLERCETCARMLCTRKAPVAPAGNPDPKVVVVGQAPGRDEDAAGEPFVGSAGELLKLLLGIVAGIDSAEVYFTNAVKCYPGRTRKGDRRPTKEEIRNCAGTWLHGELEALQPEFVLLLGQVALDAVAGSKKLKDVHGRVLVDLDVSLDGRAMAINHPSVHDAGQALQLVRGLRAFRAAVARDAEGRPG